MALHPPHVRKYVPPSDEEVARRRAEFARQREELEAARESARPARRVAILAGPSLRDVDAAIDCMCSCHPRPADLDRHDGGESCPCQENEDERAARVRAAREVWNDLSEEFAAEDRHFNEQRQMVSDEAAALGVEARIEVWAAPHVLVGVCDGRGFYLRERHGSYGVTIAHDDDLASDPWAAEPNEPTIDIASGDERDLEEDGRFSWVVALQVAVRAVRTALARNACAHVRLESEPYCPICGVRIDEADTWRWSRPWGDTSG